jgi:P-type Ca2+ transporter type 2C
VWQTFRERRNTTLKWILGGAALLLVVMLTVPSLRRAFNFGAITLGEWCVAVAAGFVAVGWFEIYKTITAQHRAQTATRTGAASADRPRTP